jgi:hypothetical protein
MDETDLAAPAFNGKKDDGAFPKVAQFLISTTAPAKRIMGGARCSLGLR